jgi:hypothetical protein
MTSNIEVDITDASEFHCFRLVFNPATGERIEILLHAASLVDLTHKLSLVLCEWQRQTTEHLICQKTGLSAEEARERGLIV